MNNNPLKLLVLFCALIFASCNSTQEEVLENIDIPANITSKTIELEILSLINNYRADKGLSKINQLNIIKSQTLNHTNYMISKNVVSHDNFYERKNFLTENARAKSVAENVAYGYSTAKTVVNAWLKSDRHKQNIEGNYNYFEVSVEKDVNGKRYYTNIFIRK